MRTRSVLVVSLGLAMGLGGGLAARAQDEPPAKLKLSGSYEVSNPRVSDETVDLDFKTTITNLGDEDVTGPVVLRHPNVIGKVWNRFGEQTISAGSSVTLSASVTIPRQEYDDWSKGGSPAVFFYMQNDRGEIKTFRIPVSKIEKPAEN